MRMVAGLPGLQGSTGISNTAGLAHDAQRYMPWHPGTLVLITDLRRAPIFETAVAFGEYSSRPPGQHCPCYIQRCNNKPDHYPNVTYTRRVESNVTKGRSEWQRSGTRDAAHRART
jgi:hypothetical protein